MDELLKKSENVDRSPHISNKIKSIDLFNVLQKLLFLVRSKLKKNNENSEINLNDKSYNYFEKLLKQAFLTSLFSSDPQFSYVGILINNPELTTIWKRQIINITTIACSYLKLLKPEQPTHQGSIVVFLNILVSFTSTSSWLILRSSDYDQYQPLGEKICRQVTEELASNGLYECLNDLLLRGLTRTKPSLKKLPLTAIITISARPLQNTYLDQHVKKFILHIFSVPALIYHINSISPEAIQILYREPILKRCLEYLRSENNSRETFICLEGNYTLCLLANLVHLAFILFKSIQPFMVEFVVMFACLTTLL